MWLPGDRARGVTIRCLAFHFGVMKNILELDNSDIHTTFVNIRRPLKRVNFMVCELNSILIL